MASSSRLRRILLVEDDPDIRAITQLALESMGQFELRACSSGDEALRVVNEFTPDLILLDVMMPGMDGPATLRALRGVPGARPVPVVFMTAKADRPDRAHYRRLGAAGVIAKPFDPMTLCDEIQVIWAQMGPKA